MAAVGLVLLFIFVFGGYIISGGKMAPIIKAAPFEFIIIAGAAIGAALVGNSFDIFKAAMGGIGKCISGPKWKQEDYLNLIVMVGKLLAVMKKEGVVALEAHVENPDSSPIFGEFPKLAKDHSIVQMICDPLRLAIISQGNLDDDDDDDNNNNNNNNSAIRNARMREILYQATTNKVGGGYLNKKLTCGFFRTSNGSWPSHPPIVPIRCIPRPFPTYRYGVACHCHLVPLRCTCTLHHQRRCTEQWKTS